MRSTVMLAYIRLLYDVSASSDMKLNGEERLALRLAKSVRILDDIKAYLERERPNVLPKSPKASEQLRVVELESVNSILRGRRLGNRQ